MERWDRRGDGRWARAGYRGSMSAHEGGELRTVTWDQVGVCRVGTRHDLKDVTHLRRERENAGPEKLWTVELAASAVDVQTAREKLAEWCSDVLVAERHGQIRMRFSRWDRTLLGAITSAARDAEAAGFEVESVSGA